MTQKAIGMIETHGLVALIQGTDAALKAANVTFKGWKKVGSVHVIARPHDDVMKTLPS